jgi:hypothetical protein
MGVAAMIAWILTALGALALTGIWLAGGGLRQQANRMTRLRAPVVFGFVGLVVVGLILWILYLTAHTAGLGLAAVVLLVIGAVLGALMVTAWVAGGGHRSTARPEFTGLTRGARSGHRMSGALGTEVAAEHRFPPAFVAGEGILTLLTLFLALVAFLTPLD